MWCSFKFQTSITKNAACRPKFEATKGAQVKEKKECDVKAFAKLFELFNCAQFTEWFGFCAPYHRSSAWSRERARARARCVPSLTQNVCLTYLHVIRLCASVISIRQVLCKFVCTTYDYKLLITLRTSISFLPPFFSCSVRMEACYFAWTLRNIYIHAHAAAAAHTICLLVATIVPELMMLMAETATAHFK